MPNQSKASKLLQQKQQAASQNTSSEQLRELAATGNKAICEKVAANPNTPTDILLKLGAKFPKQLLENPVFPLLLLENPNFVEDFPSETLISLLKEKQLPSFILDTASKHYNRDILILVASNPNTCKATLENLANSTYEEVQEAAKLHVNLAGEIQSGVKNYRSPLWLERYAIARNPNTPKHILNELTLDANQLVRAAAKAAINI